jgi:hypothetical protein
LTAIISAAVPTGTAADVVLNWSGAWNSGSVEVVPYRVVGLVGSITDAQALNAAGSSTSVSVSLNVPSSGMIIIAVTGFSLTCNAGDVTVSNPSPSDYTDQVLPSVWGSAGRVLTAQTANASRTITGHVNDNGSPNVTVAAISWQGT